MLSTVAVLAAAAASVTAIGGSAAAPAPQRTVLVVSEARGFVHDSIPEAVDFFRRLGRRDRRVAVVALRGARGLTPDRLANADAVVFANTTGELPLSARSKRALLSFVRRGGAFVGTHSATNTFDGWPPFQRMLGARFVGHPPAQTGRVVVENRRHPATRGLPRAFRARDETYEFRTPPRPRVNVLARVDPDSIEGEKVRDLPVVWSRRYGRGRVFYSALGHFGAAWAPGARNGRIVAGGLRWALRLER